MRQRPSHVTEHARGPARIGRRNAESRGERLLGGSAFGVLTFVARLPSRDGWARPGDTVAHDFRVFSAPELPLACPCFWVTPDAPAATMGDADVKGLREALPP